MVRKEFSWRRGLGPSQARMMGLAGSGRGSCDHQAEHVPGIAPNAPHQGTAA